MRHGERHATPPARQMPRCTATWANVGGTRKRDAILLEIGPTSEQGGRHAARREVEVVRT
jgi:hypothetical protein